MSARTPGRTKTASTDVPNSHEAVCLLGTREAEASACMATEDWRFGKEALRPWMDVDGNEVCVPAAMVRMAEMKAELRELKGQIGKEQSRASDDGISTGKT